MKRETFAEEWACKKPALCTCPDCERAELERLAEIAWEAFVETDDSQISERLPKDFKQVPRPWEELPFYIKDAWVFVVEAIKKEIK